MNHGGGDIEEGDVYPWTLDALKKFHSRYDIEENVIETPTHIDPLGDN